MIIAHTIQTWSKSLQKNLVILLIFFSLASHAKPLSSGWELWYPYQYRNAQQELVGLDFDIFNAVIQQAKLNVNYTEELPWKRHISYIKSGEVDLAMGASMTDERRKFAYFSLPYRSETVNLFVRKGMAKKMPLHALKDLIDSSYLIGVEGGYYYGKQYQELINHSEFQSHISEVLDLEQNVTLLLKGHIDGFFVDPVTLNAFVKKYNMQDEFEMHPLPIYSADIHIMLSKKTAVPDIIGQLNQAIVTLQETGELDAIIEHWTNSQH
ncbi:MAG: polar amino acid transport system substrate-binding protein [Paraglaciecola sp.]